MFREKLKKLRTKKNLSQEALANVLGYSRSAISAYELGRNEPSYDDLRKIADYFEVDVGFFLANSERPDVAKFENVDKTISEDVAFQSLVEAAKLSPESERMLKEYLNLLKTKDKQDRNSEEQKNYISQRKEYIKKHAKPYAAADGDASNLKTAREAFDNSIGDDEDK